MLGCPSHSHSALSAEPASGGGNCTHVGSRTSITPKICPVCVRRAPGKGRGLSGNLTHTFHRIITGFCLSSRRHHVRPSPPSPGSPEPGPRLLVTSPNICHFQTLPVAHLALLSSCPPSGIAWSFATVSRHSASWPRSLVVFCHHHRLPGCTRRVRGGAMAACAECRHARRRVQWRGA